MTYALIQKRGGFFNRVTTTSYHATPNTALYALSHETMGEPCREWDSAECWHVIPAPMGGDDEKLKRKWKIKRDV